MRKISKLNHVEWITAYSPDEIKAINRILIAIENGFLQVSRDIDRDIIILDIINRITYKCENWTHS
jgi:hypothetical protein